VARTTFVAGTFHYALGRPQLALERLQACLEMPEVAGNAEVRAMIPNYLGRVCFQLARFDEARAYFETGVALLEGTGRDVEIANSLGILAIAHGFLGEFEHGRSLADEVLRIAERIENPAARAMGQFSRSLVVAMQGGWSEAVQLAEESRVGSSRIGNALMESIALWAKGNATALQGQREAGCAWMREAIALIERSQSLMSLSAFCSRLALFCAEGGHAEEAAALARRALEVADEGGERLGEHMAHAALATLAAGAAPPRWPEAIQAMDTALRLARERGLRPELATLELRYARLLRANGDAPGAAKHLARARQAFAELGMEAWLAEADRFAADPGAEQAPDQAAPAARTRRGRA
jgi:tetratricopeptide (TPR) repeat protein